jgi:glycosyltransferase involved in cell wall biosynthesis
MPVPIERAVRPVVGLDATVLASGHGIRGIGRYVDGLLRALAADRPDWVADHLGTLVLPGQAPPTATGWRTRRSPVRPQDLDWLLAPAFDRRAVAAGRPTVWHHTDPRIPWSPLPADRTLVTVYDLIPLAEPVLLERMRPHRRLAYRRYLRLVRKAAGVVAISESTARDVVQRLGVPRDRVHVVPPYVQLDPARDRSASSPTESGSTATGAAPTFLFVGIPEPHKRPELAIDAFAAFAAHSSGGGTGRLVFVGHHPERTRAALRERARRLDVGDQTQFVDRLSDGALGQLYAGGVLLALSRIEGFGLPPAEALLAGGRVVATPCDAYDEVLGDMAVRSADASPRAVAAAMAAALERPPDPRTGAAIAVRYGASTVAAALLGAYEWILAR